MCLLNLFMSKKGGDKRGRNISFSLIIILFSFCIFLIFFVPFVTSYSGSGTGPFNCSGCPDCNSAIGNASAGAVIYLNISLSGTNITLDSNTACISLYPLGNNKTFDCQGNSITGNGSGYGVLLFLNNNNITIRNCNISNFSYGFNLNGVANSTIINNTINSNRYGIYSYSSNNINITNNSFNLNKYNGIYSYSSPYTTIFKNFINSNGNGSVSQGGIILYTSDNSTLSNNTIVNNTYGIWIGSSSNSTLKFNNFTNNQRAIYIESFYNHDIDRNNTVNNKPVYYWVNHNNDIISYSLNPGYVAVINSANVTVKDINISYSGQGILFYNMTNSSMINVTTSSNYYGIQIIGASSNIANNNSVINSSSSYNDLAGIYVSYSDNITLTNNTAYSNGLNSSSAFATGIFLRWDNKIIMRNNTMNGNKYNLLLLNSVFSLMDIDISNKMDGKSVYFLVNQMNTEINTSHNPGFVGLVNCTNITVRDLNMSNNGENFLFEGLNNSRIFNITSVTTLYNFLINGSHNNVFSDIFSNNSLQSILYFTYSTNNTMVRISSTEQYADAIYLGYSDWNKIYNSSFSNNHVGRGIYIQYTNNTLVDSVQTYNISYGITISNGYNNIVRNSVFINATDGSANGVGIILSYSDNNTLINVKTNGSLFDGVQLFIANNNTFINLTSIENNRSGVVFYKSNYNIINNSHIENNTVGLSFGLPSFTSDSNYNLIYNNYIRNGVANYQNYGVVTNFFNTTLTLGTNIVGGSYLGGNFWATMNNTGFSQLCNDSDADGICDTNYSLDGTNYDYLPLYSVALVCIPYWTCNSWSTCSGGVQNRTCTDFYSCNSTLNKPAESQFCTTGGGAPATQQSSTTTVGTITSGEPATVTITNTQVEITSITITTTETVPNVAIKVTEVKSARRADLEIGLPTGQIYQAFNITTIGLNNSQISNATIAFRVNKTWIQQRGAALTDILLYRKNDTTGKWNSLNTAYLANDSLYYYFSSLSSGFSTFLIYFGKYECNPGDRRCYNRESQLCLGNATWLITEKCGYNCNEKGECIENPFPLTNVIYTGIIIGIVAAMIVTFYLVIRRISRRGKSKTSRKTLSRFYYNQSLHKSK